MRFACAEKWASVALGLGIGLLVLVIGDKTAFAQGLPNMTLSVGGSGTREIATAMKIFFFLTLLSLAPAILLTMTSFTRMIIVLSFLRQAIGVQQSPPNQVLVGLALFLTMFLMMPIFQEVHTNAIAPVMDGKIEFQEGLKIGAEPIKKFMFAQTQRPDLELMLTIGKLEKPKTLEELPITIMIPAFILSELRIAFEIGFLIYLPFVLIDMVVATVLLTMGMMMLPPVVVSLPFKLMLFVLIDGWNIVVGSLMRSFV